MSWRPLVTDERRTAVATIVREVAQAIEAAPPSVAGDPFARALLRTYVAQADIVPDPDDAGGAALAQAATALPGVTSPALFGGVAGTAWLVAHVASGDAAELLCEIVDAALLRRLADWSGGYDLIGGLVGVGVYALERGEPGHPLAARVFEHLARMARPRLSGLAWHTAPNLLPPQQRAIAPDGYWNLGLAHGIPGVVALLARFIASGLAVGHARDLLEGAVAALLASEPANLDGRYPGWQAGGPGGDATTAPTHENRGRLAWCYNDLGVAIALLSAAQATGNDTWRREALTLARACAGRHLEEAAIFDAAVCHGALGAAHLFNRLRHATGEASFTHAALRWFERALDMRTDRPLAGFPSRTFSDGVERWPPDASLLNGAAGVALVLHSMITDVEPAWDRLLLADLEPSPPGQSLDPPRSKP